MGMRLPDVPQHEPCRTSSPEPEEVVLSDDEQPSTSTVVAEPVEEKVVPPSEEVIPDGEAIESEKRSALNGILICLNYIQLISWQSLGGGGKKDVMSSPKAFLSLLLFFLIINRSL
ncbi:hypothetical protein COOONC_07235 [Cooperia oncophora]